MAYARLRLIKRGLRILGVGIILIFVNNFLIDWTDYSYEASFDYECRENNSLPHPEIVHYCIKGPQIFFTETSGVPVLNARQACSIESTARHNPTLSVTALMTPTHAINFNHPLMHKLQTISNLRILKVDIDVLVHNSPVWIWLRKGKWKKSHWKVRHLSDALRYFLVWKYGGMYLDMDIVTLRSLENLRNSIIAETSERVAAGILIFDKGHELMKRCMYEFSNHYDPYNFVYNGPGVVLRMVKDVCDITEIDKVSRANCDVKILAPESAFPIDYDKWEKYFSPMPFTNISEYFISSYLIHVWNKYSHVKKLKIGTDSLYEMAIKQHCPIAYEYAQKIGYL